MSALQDALARLASARADSLPKYKGGWSTPTVSCRAIRQGDEVYCPVAGCGLRWSLDDDRPECPK